MKAKKIVDTLLVVDNLANVRLITKVFDRFDVKHKFNVVKGYTSAMDYLYKRGNFKDTETPDLIILKLNLSTKKGMEMIEAIEKDEKLRLIPLICLKNH